MSDIRNDDNVQHGIDDNPNDDAKKGLELGALGGGAVGAIAGSALGPVGAIVGALIGGSVGGVASGAAVAAVDAVDNDNTVSGVGDGATTDINADTNTGAYAGTPNVHQGATASGDYERGSYVGGTDVTDTTAVGTDVGGHNIVTGGPSTSEAGNTGLGAGAIAGGLLGAAAGGPVGAVVGGTLGSLVGGVAGDATEAAEDTNAGYNPVGTTYDNIGNDTPGIQTGGVTTAGQDTRGLTEKAADALTGDHRDDKTGGIVYNEGSTNVADSVRNAAHNTGAAVSNVAHNTGAAVSNAAHNITSPGNDVPGVQTGGVTTAGSDTRGVTEKAADALTGDRVDDKTGGIVR